MTVALRDCYTKIAFTNDHRQLFEVSQESADNWETKSKNKPALEAQRLPNSRFNHCQYFVKIHDIPEIYFQDTRKIK